MQKFSSVENSEHWEIVGTKGQLCSRKHYEDDKKQVAVQIGFVDNISNNSFSINLFFSNSISCGITIGDIFKLYYYLHLAKQNKDNEDESGFEKTRFDFIKKSLLIDTLNADASEYFCYIGMWNNISARWGSDKIQIKDPKTFNNLCNQIVCFETLQNISFGTKLDIGTFKKIITEELIDKFIKFYVSGDELNNRNYWGRNRDTLYFHNPTSVPDILRLLIEHDEGDKEMCQRLHKLITKDISDEPSDKKLFHMSYDVFATNKPLNLSSYNNIYLSSWKQGDEFEMYYEYERGLLRLKKSAKYKYNRKINKKEPIYAHKYLKCRCYQSKRECREYWGPIYSADKHHRSKQYTTGINKMISDGMDVYCMDLENGYESSIDE